MGATSSLSKVGGGLESSGSQHYSPKSDLISTWRRRRASPPPPPPTPPPSPTAPMPARVAPGSAKALRRQSGPVCQHPGRTTASTDRLGSIIAALVRLSRRRRRSEELPPASPFPESPASSLLLLSSSSSSKDAAQLALAPAKEDSNASSVFRHSSGSSSSYWSDRPGLAPAPPPSWSSVLAALRLRRARPRTGASKPTGRRWESTSRAKGSVGRRHELPAAAAQPLARWRRRESLTPPIRPAAGPGVDRR